MNLFHAVKQGARAIRHRPSSAVVVVVTLGLVTGAASAIFAVLYATLLKPLPFPDADRLVRVFAQPPGTTATRNRTPLHAVDYVRFREHSRLLGAVEGFWPLSRALSVADGEPEVVAAAGASPGVFELLGGSPILGRTFSPEEDRVGARVVTVSHALWQQRFGGEASIIGRKVLLDREPHEVIGVMNAGFEPGFIDAQLWTPLGIHEGHLPLPTSGFVQAFARMRPNVTMPQALAELDSMMNALAVERPATHTGWGADIDDVRTAQFGDRRAPMFILMAAAISLTLLAAANLGNLALADVTARRSEIALRLALGARINALRLQHLIEGAMLGIVGCFIGFAAASITLPFVLSIDPVNSASLGTVRADWRLAIVAAVIAIGTSVAVRLIPLGRALRDIAAAIADDDRRSAGSRRASRLRFALVSVQSGVALLLLIGGAFLLSSFIQVSQIDTGYNADGVVALRLRLSDRVYPSIEARANFVSTMLDRVRSVPNVGAAGIVTSQLVAGASYVTLVHVEGQPTPDGQPHTIQFRRVSSGYFQTLGIPQLAGRDVASSDAIEQPPVAVVSRSFAERFWPGIDPLGRRIRRAGTDNPWMTIVGVVGDARDYDLGAPAEPVLYIPFAQFNTAVAPVTLTVRPLSGDGVDLVPALRSAIGSVDPMQPVDRIVTMESFLAESVGPQRFRATLLVLFACLGLLIAAAGIYGVTWRTVEEQTPELGLRLALGASPASLRVMVVKRAMTAVIVGLTAGAIVAVSAIDVMRRTLGDAAPFSLWSGAVPLLVLIVIAVAAAAWPAYRALSLDPLVALRSK
jgi:putative ABC transport system permease protein